MGRPGDARVDLADALFIIDLQEGFFAAGGLASRRDALVAAANALSAAAESAGVPVFLITTEHSRDRSTWTLNMLDDDQGYLFHGDPSTALLEDVRTGGVTRVEKTRDSAWFGTDLELRLKTLGVDRVLLAGVSTHLCIAHTARDAYAHNIRAVVVADAVADEDEGLGGAVLAQLERDRQASLTTVAEAVAAWDEAPPGSRGPAASRQ